MSSTPKISNPSPGVKLLWYVFPVTRLAKFPPDIKNPLNAGSMDPALRGFLMSGGNFASRVTGKTYQSSLTPGLGLLILGVLLMTNSTGYATRPASHAGRLLF